MTHVLYLAFLFVVGFQAGRMTYRDVARYRQRRRHNSRLYLMTRILRLELELGIGLEWSEKWLRERPADRLHPKCWGCAKDFAPRWMRSVYLWSEPRERYDPELEARLCPACIQKTQRELADL